VTALAAVFSARGAPDRNAEVTRMLDAAPHRGHLRPFTWSSHRVTLGYRGRCATRAEFDEGSDGSAIVFDGRIDNRDDLRRQLFLDRDAHDARITREAYAKWGEQAPAFILGDFAFALWDAARGRLVAARDSLGQRPLFYASLGGITLIASEPQQILAHPSVTATMNDGAVAEFLTGRPASVDETVWMGVMRLRPAHALLANESGTRCARYWDFDPEARLEYARDEEYAEHFTALFREAVECRTRDANVVGIFLSGGLDSSAIAGTAETLARERGGPHVRAFSLTFPGLSVDETPYISAVRDRWHLPSVQLPARAPARGEIETEIARHRDLPAYPNGAMLDPLRRRAAADVGVVLTGYGGDDWFTGTPLHTADLLKAGRFAAAATQLAHDIVLPGRGYSTAALLRTAIAPLLSPRTRAWLRPIAGTSASGFPWIRPEFAARVQLADRLRPVPRRRCRTFVQSEIHRMANSLAQVLGDELEDRAAAAAGIDQRHPFNDRRLAEFGFSLPESQRWSGGETKVLMRRALDSVLPPLVRDRNDKAEFTPVLVETIEGLGGRAFLSSLSVAEAGWVDLPAIQRTYDDMTRLYRRGNESYIPLADAVWSVAAAELWFIRHSKERRQ